MGAYDLSPASLILLLAAFIIMLIEHVLLELFDAGALILAERASTDAIGPDDHIFGANGSTLWRVPVELPLKIEDSVASLALMLWLALENGSLFTGSLGVGGVQRI